MTAQRNILVTWGDDIGITGLSCYSDAHQTGKPRRAGKWQSPYRRVIGNSVALEYRDGRLVHTAERDIFDDGPAAATRSAC
uniref:hypothetical protein n=1 Tax=Paractinoplanes polyasparticus TaxID=2856853 RepID=UPI001C85F8D9|nr:hypothetical protein [Actinoplanes polyasparticus]